MLFGKTFYNRTFFSQFQIVHNTICTSMFFVHFFCNFYNGTWWWNSLFSLMSLVVQDSKPLLQISIGKLSLKNWPKIMVPFSHYLSVAMFQIISQLITQKKKSIIQLTVFGISSSFSYFFKVLETQSCSIIFKQVTNSSTITTLVFWVVCRYIANIVLHQSF